LLQELFVKLAKQPGLLDAARDEGLPDSPGPQPCHRPDAPPATRGKNTNNCAESAPIFAPAVEPDEQPFARRWEALGELRSNNAPSFT